MSSKPISEPTSEWITTRIRLLEIYASLDWLGLGEHLNQRSMTLGNLCTTIYRDLHALITNQSSFHLASFCTVIAKIDHLWQIIYPSHLEGITSPTVLVLLDTFGKRPDPSNTPCL